MATDNRNDPAYPIQDTDQRGDLCAPNFGFSKLELACIKSRIPETGVRWLDEKIRKGRRQEMAAKAMQGMMTLMIPRELVPILSNTEYLVKLSITATNLLIQELDKDFEPESGFIASSEDAEKLPELCKWCIHTFITQSCDINLIPIDGKCN